MQLKGKLCLWKISEPKFEGDKSIKNFSQINEPENAHLNALFIVFNCECMLEMNT